MRNRWIGLVVAGIAFAVAIWAYPQLPPRVPSHWNIRGEVDGYAGRFVAAFVFPLAILFLAGLVHVLPRIDPRGENYPKFHDTYWLLINGVLIFMGVVYLAVIGNAIGAPIPIGTVMPIALGFLFIVVGNYLGRVQPNWFLGIRTPWTLSSDTVWRKTHRLGSWVFVIAGLLFMVSGLVPGVRFGTPLLAIIIALVATPVLYSLYLWMRERSS
ncbi:MAG: SdpI family protein [Gemmatimonadota bacterium]|nr:SdpI family protein [Gemmatimonadota bacterium]